VNITFTYNGEQYNGDLSQVQGAGDTGVYHLMINKYYKKRLRLSAFDNRWVFDGEFADLAEGFAMWLDATNWIKSEIDTNYESLFYSLAENSDIEEL